jgi:hypothetical protein
MGSFKFYSSPNVIGTIKKTDECTRSIHIGNKKRLTNYLF